jgi:hypothetical protein
MLSTNRRLRAAARGTLSVALLGLATGCSNLLVVDNPAAITDPDLNNPELINILANSVLGDFQRSYDDWVYFSAILTDEAVTGHNFETWKVVDQRILQNDNGTMNANYNSIHSARALADTTAGRFRNLLPNPGQDLRMAQVLALGGYSYIFAGEFLCESPLNVSAEIYSSDELTAFALPRLQEALTVAQAAQGAGASATASNQWINLARVGLGRAHLQLGNRAEAAAAVANVPADFVFWMNYSLPGQGGSGTNTFNGATTGANRNLGVDASFRFLNDPRVRHTATSQRGHNNLTDLWTPFQSPAFSGWEPGSTTGFLQDTKIRLASGVEAGYILAEAQGPTAATLAFVNSRRAVGGQDPVDLTGDALMAELRDQRRRDLYFNGHRLGDLRRYKAQGVGDLFPSGPHPNASWGDYQTGECIPVPLTERIGNPNLGG